MQLNGWSNQLIRAIRRVDSCYIYADYSHDNWTLSSELYRFLFLVLYAIFPFLVPCTLNSYRNGTTAVNVSLLEKLKIEWQVVVICCKLTRC